ncbi:MAG: PIN domain-containing protein [Armatimonadetes bacterium]|nr:PIN domain-containing protein [Armatimonadota bacterium]
MTLTDAGPLVSLINRGDAQHHRCSQALPRLSSPLLTTWPCFTEAMYLLGRIGGHPAQAALWGYLRNDLLRIRASTLEEVERMDALMLQYRDTPMDLADASMVAAAEALQVHRIFTLDTDFYVYRIGGTQAFEVVP